MTFRKGDVSMKSESPEGKRLFGFGLVGAVVSGFLASACCWFFSGSAAPGP